MDLNEMISKLDNMNFENRVGVIYTWIKQGVIQPKQFRKILNHFIKENNKEIREIDKVLRKENKKINKETIKIIEKPNIGGGKKKKFIEIPSS